MATVLGSRPVASAAPLPQTTLARGGQLPIRADWSFEVKWDGFRAIVSTEDEPSKVRSRRGWSMIADVPELAELPAGLVLDGELVAFNGDEEPHFPLLSRRVLHTAISRASRDKHDRVRRLSDRRRRRCCPSPLLRSAHDDSRSSVSTAGTHGRRPRRSKTGQALFDAVCERGLEGVVAKPHTDRYTSRASAPGSRSRTAPTWRWQMERERALLCTRARGTTLTPRLTRPPRL